MIQEEKSICPACGKSVKVGSNFCTNCGKELDRALTNSELTSQFPIKGWEVPPNRIKLWEKIVAQYPLRKPIITSNTTELSSAEQTSTTSSTHSTTTPAFKFAFVIQLVGLMLILIKKQRK